MNSRLGRGLNALLPMKAILTEGQQHVAASLLKEIRVDAIGVSAHQARKTFSEAELHEFAESIKKFGVLEPILVSQKTDGQYTLIAGERRLRASKIAGIEKIPAIIKNLGEKETAFIGLIENVQRQDLNPLEFAQALERMIGEFQLTHQEIADTVGISRSRVTNMLRLLTLPDVIKEYLANGHLNEGQARALLSIENEQERDELARRIAEEQLHLSVRDIERRARTRQKDPDIANYEQKLQDILKTKVRIMHSSKNKSGWVSIRYADLDGFDSLCKLLASAQSINN
ncbi:MAG: ParB/RepB/Spo0J family partition protein [Elusimicrobiota bacterium]